MTKIIHWFREDLRLTDNPALFQAATEGQVIPVYLKPNGMGAASRWWLHHSLTSLKSDLHKFNLPLILKSGQPEQVLPKLAKQLGASKVVWNRVYSPVGIKQGKLLKTALNQASVNHASFNGQLLIEPTQVLTKQGTPFKVFTPFWRHCSSELNLASCLTVPDFSNGTGNDSVNSDVLSDWSLLPTNPDWSGGLKATWQVGEKAAQRGWQSFLESNITGYQEQRDFPELNATSHLSPHLAFGEISPRQLWQDVHEAMAHNTISGDDGSKFLAEIGWREFSHYLLVHFPHILNAPFNPRFEGFEWQDSSGWLQAWQRGETGYPIVDAGMRELWHTGYIHNRVRMVVASFLTKHLRTHWQHGMNWFWDTLVDADVANNTVSWQWVAGCGADAAPYFRIFNPVLQGEKFDKAGDYVKRWVPELAGLASNRIHKPWEATAKELTTAGVVLDQHYPMPIVDHREARELALEAYQGIKS